MKKVLVGAPVNQHKEYCREQYIHTLKSLTYPDYDIYCVDNSSDRYYHAKNFIMRGVDCDWINPENKKNNIVITESQNLIRHRAISGNYDYLILIEEDIVPPSDIIEQLISYNQPIATARYFIRHGQDAGLLAFDIEAQPTFGDHTNRRMDGFEAWLDFDGSTTSKSKMFGTGIILISTEILKHLYFEVRPNQPYHSDMYLWMVIQENQIPYAVHPLIVQHNNSSWQKIIN